MAKSRCCVAKTMPEIREGLERSISAFSEVAEPRVSRNKPANSSPGSTMVVQAAEAKSSVESFCTLTKLCSSQEHGSTDVFNSRGFDLVKISEGECQPKAAVITAHAD
jgi:hypothetical protein